MPTKVRYLLAVLSVGILFLAFGIAPLSTLTTEQTIGNRFEPGKMPSQQIITAATKEAEVYLAALKTEYIPEPEPEPKEESGSALESEEEDSLHLQTAEAATTESIQPVQPPPTYTGGGSPEVWMAAAGIAPGDWGYVDYIATRESGWNPNATNPSSGACGLIQAHPCSKVPGSGYDPVNNLTWADGYAKSRYGSWQAAYNFWTQNSWW